VQRRSGQLLNPDRLQPVLCQRLGKMFLQNALEVVKHNPENKKGWWVINPPASDSLPGQRPMCSRLSRYVKAGASA
jgi:hypothetical protein